MTDLKILNFVCEKNLYEKWTPIEKNHGSRHCTSNCSSSCLARTSAILRVSSLNLSIMRLSYTITSPTKCCKRARSCLSFAVNILKSTR
ncbi:hypothetical protein Hanom_Chr03g00254251 [Helianthus anomalus]